MLASVFVGVWWFHHIRFNPRWWNWVSAPGVLVVLRLPPHPCQHGVLVIAATVAPPRAQAVGVSGVSLLWASVWFLGVPVDLAATTV